MYFAFGSSVAGVNPPCPRAAFVLSIMLCGRYVTTLVFPDNALTGLVDRARFTFTEPGTLAFMTTLLVAAVWWRGVDTLMSPTGISAPCGSDIVPLDWRRELLPRRQEVRDSASACLRFSSEIVTHGDLHGSGRTGTGLRAERLV